MEYGGNYYYYRTNIQGDIEGIYNSNGTLVVSYSYDAWGNILSTTGTLASTLGEINPFRYRGYYYDTETGWYYLQSRYYDPTVGRFLNADNLVYLSSGGILSNNLYTYCYNNSVSNTDPSGFAPFLGWGVQLEGSFMGLSGGIELVWFKSIAKGLYGNRNLPCVYVYGGFAINIKGGNVWNIKSLIEYVKDSALRAFGSAKKAAWKIGGSLSLCAFLVYGTITDPKGYIGPFITTGLTLFNIKTYYSRSPKGDVHCWGLGISSSKFGFSPMSASLYGLVPASIVISVANWFSPLLEKIKAVTNLI